MNEKRAGGGKPGGGFGQWLPRRWFRSTGSVVLGSALAGYGLTAGLPRELHAAQGHERGKVVQVVNRRDRTERATLGKLVLALGGDAAFASSIGHSSHRSHRSHSSHRSHVSSRSGGSIYTPPPPTAPPPPPPPPPAAPDLDERDADTAIKPFIELTPSKKPVLEGVEQVLVIEVTAIEIGEIYATSSVSGIDRSGRSWTFGFAPSTEVRRLTPIEEVVRLDDEIKKLRRFPLLTNQEVAVRWKTQGPNRQQVASRFTVLD